jgi:hypothetical protein
MGKWRRVKSFGLGFIATCMSAQMRMSSCISTQESRWDTMYLYIRRLGRSVTSKVTVNPSQTLSCPSESKRVLAGLCTRPTDRRAQGLTTTDLDTSSQRALLFLHLCSSYKSYPSRGNQFNGVVFASIDGPMVITAHGLGANTRPDRP